MRLTKRVNAPAGATSGKYYPVVVMRSAGSSKRTGIKGHYHHGNGPHHPMNNCEFNGFVHSMVAGLTGALCLWNVLAISKNERAIHLMMSNKGDDLRSVFYPWRCFSPVLRLSKMACQYPHPVLISLLMIRPISLGQQIRRLNVSRRTLSLILRVGVVL